MFVHLVNGSTSLFAKAPLPDSASARELRQYEVNPLVLLSIPHPASRNLSQIIDLIDINAPYD
jgi:hypothetical protein